MSRQSEFKKRFDPEMGKYTRQHIYGEGIMLNMFKNIDKLPRKTVKSYAKKNAEKVLSLASAKTGKKAGDKIVSILSKEKKPKKNSILSGGKII